MFNLESSQNNIKVSVLVLTYNQEKYVDDFDRPYFKQASVVATMSPKARDILQKHFRENHRMYSIYPYTYFLLFPI